MQNLDIPASIWLNLGVLVAAAGAVWFKLRTIGHGRRNGKRVPPGERDRASAHARRAARMDR